MPQSFFPLRHPFVCLPFDPSSLVHDAVNAMFADTSCSAHVDEVFGHLSIERFYPDETEQPFVVDDDGYFLDEFLIALTSTSADAPDLLGSKGPAMIVAKLYHVDDPHGRRSDDMRYLVYINPHCLDSFQSKVLRDLVLTHKLSTSPGSVSARSYTYFDAWDFPIYAMQMFQRTMGIDPRV